MLQWFTANIGFHHIHHLNPRIPNYRLAACHAAIPALQGVQALNGGLLAYVSDLPDLFRRAAEYVDRVLKGEKPGVLPVQMPTRVELVINIKTARRSV